MFNHIIVLPTYACNCRCPYCYEDHSAVNMPDEVYESIKRLLVIQKNNGLSKLHLEFFGGEPLLCLEKVMDLSAYANELIQDNYNGCMTTNGTLLNYDVFQKLNDAGVRGFQITLDGPKLLHDQRRVLANGKGSFDAIWKNLMAAKNSDLSFQITIRVHVTPETFDLIDQFSKTELSIFQSDKRFDFHYHPIVPLGGPHDSELNMYATREDAEKALDMLPLKESSKYPKTCYASSPSSIVILPNGDLAKCTVSLSKGVVGKLLPDGKVKMDNRKLSAWSIASLRPEENIVCPRNYLIANTNQDL